MESAGVKNQEAAFFSVVREKLSNKSKDKPTEENPEKSNEIEIEIDPPVCRICLEGPKNSGLISPCFCCGSCALVHLKCLEIWLTTSTRKTDECEICQSLYKLKILRINPHFSQYIRQTRAVAVDLVSFIFLTLAMFVQSVLVHLVLKKKILANENMVFTFGVLFFFFLIFSGYFLWMHTIIKAHISQWKEFKIEHQKVKLFPLKSENTDNNNNHNNNAVSMDMETETEIEAIGEVESSRDLFCGQNTAIQMNDYSSVALLNCEF